MRLIYFLFIVFLFPIKGMSQSADYIFKNVNIITMKDDKVLKNSTIVIKDGKIIDIGKKTKYKAKNIIDAKGKFLMPSMADAHVHLPATNDELENFMLLNLINGVAKLRSMRGIWEDFERKGKYNTEKSYFPKLYISSPPMHRNYDLSISDLENYVIDSKDFDFIKILSIKNEKTLRQLDSLCKKHNISLGGHFPYTKGETFADDLTLNAYGYIEHLGGLIGEPETFAHRMRLIKDNNIIICPTMQWYAIGYGQYGIDEMLNQRGMEYIPLEIKTDWAEKSKIYREKLGKEGFEQEKTKYAKEMQERFNVTKKLQEQGTILLISPDCSTKFIVPGFGMLEEMKLYKKAGLSNYEILKSATVNFALLFDENYGTIEIGKDADFLLLSRNPLEDILALENIDEIFFNKNYITNKELKAFSEFLLSKVQN